MEKVGDYELGPCLWDADMEAWYIRMGMKSRSGLIIHYSIYGSKPEIAENRADILARILTALRPGDLKPKDKRADKLIDDALNAPE